MILNIQVHEHPFGVGGTNTPKVIGVAMARELELRQTDGGASVALVTPYDPIVYERTSQKKGITVAALSQIAVDLLTSPGE